MPIVENPTAAELNRFQCKGCGKKFKDFILFKCEACLRKGWYEIVLDPNWFPGKLDDGSPDWNSVKKDEPQFTTEWSYGRLNIKTMEMERVPIDRDGQKKWDYLDYSISTAKKDADEYSALLRELSNNRHKTPRELKQEEKHKQKMEKEFTKIEKRDQEEANPITHHEV